MISIRRVLGSVAMLVLWSVVSQAADLTPHQLYERAAPAVVLVTGYGAGGDKGSGGTGSIISRDGLVLTNAHVVLDEKTGKPYSRLTVYLKPDRVTGNPQTDLSRAVKVTVVGYSQPLDLALLRMENPPSSLPVIELADSGHVQIGDRVVAIGHPEQGGLWTLTTGVISAEFENFNNTRGKNVFQTETGLNRGNSGGPLLDGEGHVVGINTAIARLASDGMPITSISFSLKSNVAQTWLRDQGAKFASAGTSGESVSPKTKVIATTDLPSAPAAPPAVPASPPTQTGKSNATGKAPSSSPPVVAQNQSPARPYNLDQLLSDMDRAQAEMEDMIKDSRQEIDRRSRRMGGSSNR
jgi:serine protease Do